ncbi:MAG: translation initiation factor IF-2 associated domain-containing protein, partial [Phycisphaerales bacterium]|nr:translation initiation factor IF-2 associated domain-containing protein [Phycisphaerales bacterium]
MTDVTVKQFATVVGIPVDRLLEQFAEAGITINGAEVTITEKQKLDLLAHLRKSHGNRPAQETVAEPKRITLKRKTHSEIKMAGGGAGQIKTVSVEVRKKRTYVKRSSIEEEAGSAGSPVAAAEIEERRRHGEDPRKSQAQPGSSVEAVSPRPSDEVARRQAEAEEAARRQAEAEEAARR